MRTFTLKALVQKQTSLFTFFTIGLLLVSGITHAQLKRNYSLVYSDNIKGGTTFFGNTLLNIIDNGSVNTTKMNDNSANGNSTYGNDNQNMQFADIDGKTGNGSVTRNSSSSDLVLPGGTNTIKLARLYWGGRVTNTDYNMNVDSNKSIKIRKGTSSVYSTVNALGIDEVDISGSYTQYQAYADVTAFVQNNGAGTYEVGNAALSVGAAGGGNGGGWCIVVVYENSASVYNSVRVYDGYQTVYNGGTAQSSTVTLTGLNLPSGALSAGDATMGVLAWEGDANLKKDYLKINGHLFSNATNQSDNPWNGTITNNGVHVTTKNPNYTNQMGLDIDQFDIGAGYGITGNASSVTLEFGTEADQYFPGVFGFAIKMKDPTVTLTKTVADANNDHLAETNEVLTYTLKGENSGAGNANSVIVTDTLPSTVTYVPNSLKVISSPGIAAGIKTDASGDDIAEYIVNGGIKTIIFRLGTGATASAGGTLASNESYEVQFQVTVNQPQANQRVPSIMNIARIKAKSDANIDFVDDGTAIINPDNGPLPVTLLSFTGILQQSKVKIDWSTETEINCSRYEVERSFDGRVFSKVATIAGSGTTSSKHAYSITDDISSADGAIVYYRLKQIDLDGKSTYSKVISVKLKKEDRALSISPNPFSSYLNINTEWSKAEVITAKVINVQGKEVVSKSIQMSKGLNYITIDELSKLPAGNYFIQFISQDDRFTQKITKQ